MVAEVSHERAMDATTGGGRQPETAAGGERVYAAAVRNVATKFGAAIRHAADLVFSVNPVVSWCQTQR